MPKVLLLTGDAAESLEVMYPYQRLIEEGYQVDIAAPSAKKLQFVIHDFVDEFDTYTEKLGYSGARPPGMTRATYCDGSTSANAKSAGHV
jgi:putative intracellular protease/amidase